MARGDQNKKDERHVQRIAEALRVLNVAAQDASEDGLLLEYTFCVEIQPLRGPHEAPVMGAHIRREKSWYL